MSPPRRVAVLGAAGQLGSELIRVLGNAAAWTAIPLDRQSCDVTVASDVESALTGAQPDAVINCVAYNLVDKAEDEPEAAFAVNALGVRQIALGCAARQIPLMHISTDHVFGGERAPATPWTTGDLPLPIGVYANSKLAGEHFVRSISPQHYVVRTCGLYGRQATKAKGNFVETMLRLGRERSELKIVADQVCTPTSAADLAEWLVALLNSGRFGLHHATNSGAASWYEFACEIFRLAEISVTVHPIPSAEYPTRARRPAYSVLDCAELAAVLGAPPRPWQEALAEYLRSR